MSDLPRNFYGNLIDMAEPAVGLIKADVERWSASPIETAFATALVVTARLHGVKVVLVSPADPLPAGAEGDIFLAFQRRLPPYVADFVLGQRRNGQDYKLVVECDGHAFHERTKEQAAHDRQRDRTMQAAGYRVLRFTGSEVYRDAFQCAGEALLQLVDLPGNPESDGR